MRRVLASFLLAAAPAAADCLLGGTVLDGVTHKPLAGTSVYARWKGESAKPAVLHVTDANGAFCFERLPSGDYDLIAHHAGYLTSVAGGSPGHEGGKLFAVGAQTPDRPVQIVLLPFASISGTVVDARGEPVPGAIVQVLRKRWSRGWNLESTDATTADDRGSFRLMREAPGTCYLQAGTPWQPRAGFHYLDENGQLAHPAQMRTYYPNSPTQERAAPLVLEPGQQLTNLTVAMLAAVPRRISGHVPVTWPQGLNPIVRLMGDSQVTNSAQLAQVKSDGSFTAENLYPARYTVLFDGVQPELFKLVDVTAGDADGVVLEPRPASAAVRVAVDTAGQPVIQSMELVNLADGTNFFGMKDSQGVYVFHVEPGRYRVRARSKDVFVQSVVIDGRARADSTIAVAGDSGSVVRAVMSNRLARIEAQIERPETTAASSGVMLVWEDEANSIADVQGDSKPVSENGTAEARSLAPGKYRLFAIEGFDEHPWGCPELAAALKEKSVEVAVGEGEWRKVTVPVISFGEWAAALRKVGM